MTMKAVLAILKSTGTIDESEWKVFFSRARARDHLKRRASLGNAYLQAVFNEFDVTKRGFLGIDDLQNIVQFMNL